MMHRSLQQRTMPGRQLTHPMDGTERAELHQVYQLGIKLGASLLSEVFEDIRLDRIRVLLKQ